MLRTEVHAVAVAAAFILAFFCQSGTDILILALASSLFAATALVLPVRAQAWSIFDSGMAAFALAIVVAAAHSKAPGLSFSQAQIQLMVPFGYFAVRGLFRNGTTEKSVLWLILSVSTGFSIQALVQFVSGDLAGGPFLDPNLFSGYLTFPVFLAMGAALSGRLSRKELLILGALLIPILMTKASIHSRGSLLSMVVAGALFFTFAALSNKVQSRALLVGLVLFIVATLGVAPMAAKRLPGLAEDPSVQSRIAQISSTLEMISDNPAGSGLGTWARLYPSYRQVEDVDSAGNQAHNDYLQGMAEGGPSLAIAYLIPLALALLALVRMRRQREWPMLGVGAAFWLIAISIQAAVNFVFVQAAVALAIGGAVALLSREETASDWHFGRKSTEIGMWLACLGLVVWNVSNAITSGIGPDIPNRPRPPEEFTLALADSPFAKAQAMQEAALILSKKPDQASKQKAKALLESASQADPIEASLYANRAAWLIQNGSQHPDEIYRLLDKALTLNPTNLYALRLMANHLTTVNPAKSDEAFARIKTAQSFPATDFNRLIMSKLADAVKERGGNPETPPWPRKTALDILHEKP